MKLLPRFNLTFLLIPVFVSVAFLSLSSTADDSSWSAPRTEHSYPDFQGLWTNPSQTPLQRPAKLGNRRAYTTEEALQLEQVAREIDIARTLPLALDRPAPPRGGDIDQQADGNFEIMPTAISSVAGEYRTSLIIDPLSGRLPYLRGARDIYAVWNAQGHGRFDGPEIRGVLERCLSPGGQLPLLFAFGGPGAGNPGGDNPVRNIQIVQNKDYVVILSEYFSSVRIVRLGTRHIENQGNKWMGDSIAYYEGDSLVIHSNNFRPEQSTFFLRSSSQLEITETYTLVSADELLFSYTFTDPEIYSRSFTAEIPLQRMKPGQKIYEYACHEGNYSMISILRGARMEESLK